MTTQEKQVILTAFGHRLAVLRTRKRMSLRWLSAISKIDPSDIVKYEKGKVSPTLTTIITLAKALEVEPTELLTFDNNDNHNLWR